jgi:C-terminal processing protease CtpA/Prc
MNSKFTYINHFANPEKFQDNNDVTDSNGRIVVNKTYKGTQYTQPVTSLGFAGEVVILTSGNTSSAASEFVAIAKHHKRVVIVGEETGGGYYGGTGGKYINLTLPNSKIGVRIPAIRIFNAVSEDFEKQPKGRGTIPDYIVTPGIRDVIKGIDVQKQKALMLLKDSISNN